MILDTNALLWLLEDASALGAGARARISGGPVWFSAVSITEITIKAGLGKLPRRDVIAGAAAAGLRELPLTAGHGAAIANFDRLVRHDPFDRMLLGQAHIEGMLLLTSDRVLLTAEPDLTLDARV